MKNEKEATTKNVVRSVRSMLKVLRSGGEVTNIQNAKEQENLEYANLVIKAEDFVKDYIEKNGTKGFIAERLRNGFIGNLVYTDNGTSYIQSVRGKPFGTVVAIRTSNDIVIGTSYLDSEDQNKPFPIVGLYLALTRAIKALDEGFERTGKCFIKSRARKQIEHFEKRALAYFHPEVYSYSRGQEGKKVVYENYDIIKARREAVLNAKV